MTGTVDYRISFEAPIVAEGRHIRQSGGSCRYGVCTIRLEPAEGYQFTNLVSPDDLPTEYVQAIEEALLEWQRQAPTSKGSSNCPEFPFGSLHYTLLAAQYHEVDSSSIAFKIAACMAQGKAYQQGRPVLMEPIVRLKVVSPAHFESQLVHDLSGRRASSLKVEQQAESVTLTAAVPLAELNEYPTALTELTAGLALLEQQSSSYAPVPAQLAEDIISTRRQQRFLQEQGSNESACENLL